MTKDISKHFLELKKVKAYWNSRGGESLEIFSSRSFLLLTIKSLRFEIYFSITVTMTKTEISLPRCFTEWRGRRHSNTVRLTLVPLRKVPRS